MTNTAEAILQSITVNFKPTTRRDKMEGQEYLVVPMVMITEGVHAGSNGPLYYPPEELAKTPVVWNHKPVVICHPTIKGQAVSACDPKVVDQFKVGVIMNTSWDGKTGRLKAEAWLREDRLKQIDGRVLDAVKSGQMVEVSTGLFTDNEEKEGEWKGETYKAIARNFRPDHLAILPDQKGSCSIADGAGLLRNEATEWLTGNVPKLDEGGSVLLVNKGGQLSWWPSALAINEVSHNELYSKLSDAVRGGGSDQKMSLDGPFVIDVFDTYVITSKGGKFFKQDYTKKDNSVELTGQPVEVVRTTYYITADGKIVGNKEQSMDKKKIVDGLIANASTQWEEEDREHLMAMSEDRLQKLATNAKAPVVEEDEEEMDEEEVDEEEAKKPVKNAQTVDQFIANAPADMQEVLREGIQTLGAEKARLIKVITTNKANTFKPEYLQGKQLGELRAIAALAKGSEPVRTLASGNAYLGMGDAAPVENASQEEDEPLVMPTINFGK